jgi:hypothetical protein
VLQFHSSRIGGGVITEHSAVRDDLGMLRRLGAGHAEGRLTRAAHGGLKKP